MSPSKLKIAVIGYLALNLFCISGCIANFNVEDLNPESRLPSEIIAEPEELPISFVYHPGFLVPAVESSRVGVAAFQSPKSFIIGQASFADTQLDAATLFTQKDRLLAPRNVTAIGNGLAVADYGNNRVLLWLNRVPNSFSDMPDLVLGQPDFIQSSPNLGKGLPLRNSLSRPAGVFSDGTRIGVVDSGNNRVLIWNSIPNINNSPADIIIGQTSSFAREPNQGLSVASASSLNDPSSGVFFGSKILIADRANNRVLIFNTTPSIDGASADGVLGQIDFISNSVNKNGGVSSASLNQPYGLAISGSKLLIADSYNHRVLIFNSLSSNPLGPNADVVLGQPNFNSNSANNPSKSAGLSYPMGIYTEGTSIFITDYSKQNCSERGT